VRDVLPNEGPLFEWGASREPLASALKLATAAEEFNLNHRQALNDPRVTAALDRLASDERLQNIWRKLDGPEGKTVASLSAVVQTLGLVATDDDLRENYLRAAAPARRASKAVAQARNYILAQQFAPVFEWGASREAFTFGLKLAESTLREQGLNSIAGAMSALIELLADLDRGVVAPCLRPAKVQNRPPDGAFAVMVKAAVAGMCDALIRRGGNRKETAKRVARLLNKHSGALGIGPVTARTVLEWRDSFKSKDLKSSDRRHTEWLLWAYGDSELTSLDWQLGEWGRRRQASYAPENPPC
jgi:hypothetical protein